MGTQGIPHLSALATVALHSLRDVQVQMFWNTPKMGEEAFDPPIDSDIEENEQVILDWTDTCGRLAHAPPSQLRLFLVSCTILVEDSEAMLEPLLKVQLKECSIRLGAKLNNRLQRYVDYVVSRTTENHRNKNSPSFRRFGDLPTELQMKVLQHTDLVPSTEIISRGLEWDPQKKTFFSCVSGSSS
jgi:hypothetical protein